MHSVGSAKMDNDTIIQKIKSYEHDYKSFMNIKTLPEYSIITKTASINVAEMSGFESLASTKYDLNGYLHTLYVSSNLPLYRYVLFHEFTHILDTEMYVNKDICRYIGISGYLEYHASQIELMELLRAKSNAEVISFSVRYIIETISGKKTVIQYLSEKYQHAVELFCRNDFPSDINMLNAALGVLFNYWGLRSICKMYSTDFIFQENNQVFLNIIPNADFNALNCVSAGWMDSTKRESCITLYFKTILSLIKKYDLK